MPINAGSRPAAMVRSSAPACRSAGSHPLYHGSPRRPALPAGSTKIVLRGTLRDAPVSLSASAHMGLDLCPARGRVWQNLATSQLASIGGSVQRRQAEYDVRAGLRERRSQLSCVRRCAISTAAIIISWGTAGTGPNIGGRTAFRLAISDNLIQQMTSLTD
jgi:hypothetical protein